jgi:hypothetical protein
MIGGLIEDQQFRVLGKDLRQECPPASSPPDSVRTEWCRKGWHPGDVQRIFNPPFIFVIRPGKKSRRIGVASRLTTSSTVNE